MAFNNFLKQLTTGDTVKDFAHASRTFVDGGMRLHPKVGFLYHVFFDLNPDVTRRIRTSMSDIELGLMAKNVSLPKFSMDVKSYNAYNRTNLVQSKIKYDPVTITFHDDMANVVNKFWFQYYSYYYQDTRYTESLYAADHKYQERQQIDWGLQNAGVASYEPFIRNIRIYQLHKKQFTEYVLVNPMITGWQHGEQNYSVSDPVENQMTIQYETVLYNSGNITPETVKGFADIHYDKEPSPLTPEGGGTNSIIGPGGVLDTVDSILGDVGQGDLLGAVFKTARGIENFSDFNLKGIIKEEGNSILRSIIGGKDISSRTSFPGLYGNRRR